MFRCFPLTVFIAMFRFCAILDMDGNAAFDGRTGAVEKVTPDKETYTAFDQLTKGVPGSLGCTPCDPMMHSYPPQPPQPPRLCSSLVLASAAFLSAPG